MPHSTFPTEFPILYHGTSQNSLIGMIERGIMPRGGTGKDNWQHTVTSNPKTVYLSNCFAHYFAFSAEKEKEGGAALEIDVAKLAVVPWGYPQRFRAARLQRGGISAVCEAMGRASAKHEPQRATVKGEA